MRGFTGRVLVAAVLAALVGCAPAGPPRAVYTGPTEIPTADGGSTPAGTSSAAPSRPVAGRVLVNIPHGTAKHDTGVFVAPDHWTITYSYTCGSSGFDMFEVDVFEVGTDYPIELPVSDFGKASGRGTTNVYHAGSLHLQIDTDCTYSLKAVTVG